MTNNLIFLCFLLAQLFDGWATVHGVSLFGTSVEGNPILRFLMDGYDVLAVVAIAKLACMASGYVLLTLKLYFVLAALTIFYLVVAVCPWAFILLKSS
jgi:hypothetical protein